MKKVILIILTLLLIFMIGVALFWEPVIDALPIDQSGWKTEDEGIYYLNEKGDPLTGWQDIDGKRYFFDRESGAMCTGWVADEGKMFYLDENGNITPGWFEYRYFHEDGSMATGWTEIYGTRFYFLEDGLMATGWTEIDGSLYYFSEAGSLCTGWLELDGSHYYLTETGSKVSGWQELEESRYYFDENGIMQTGWTEVDGTRYYLNEDGTAASEWLILEGIFYRLNDDGSVYSGWLEQDIGTFYIQEDGTPYLGWLEEDGVKYYLRPDTGTLAKGRLDIDGETYFFTSTGANIVLVNPWNYIPEDYEVELVTLDDGHQIAAEMYDALMQMLADCEAAGHKAYLYSAYRTQSHQQTLFNNMVAKQNGDRKKAAQIVAVPGTSEHQLGLAVDITDNSLRKLNYDQEKTATQKWLMEHCWDYGFILRYPSDRSTVTGIIYEPWHYRYVGLELALELKELGLCLEEYLDMLTGDGTTCGGT